MRHETVILYEPEAEGIAESLEEMLSSKGEEVKRFDITKILPFWRDLKKWDWTDPRADDREARAKVFTALLQLLAFLKALQLEGKKNGKRNALLLVIDASEGQ